MKVRELQLEDLAKIRSLHEQSSQFPLPHLDNSLYLAQSVVEENGQIVGFGCLRRTSEAIIILDSTQGTRVRGLALSELIRTGVYQCQKLGFAEMHAFLTGPNQGEFERVLRKNFGFDGHTGNVLVLNV